MTQLHMFKVPPGILILFIFLLKHELRLENWISDVTILFDFLFSSWQDDDLFLNRYCDAALSGPVCEGLVFRAESELWKVSEVI